ncbi:hypothetical protein QL285_084866 [Trifolium repens]|nr:hypothetical protein QL285_084866 [Trifolium repens]
MTDDRFKLTLNLEHFQYLLLGLSFEFEINNLIGLLQPHCGIWNGTALATEEDDMLEKKRIDLEKSKMKRGSVGRERNLFGNLGISNLLQCVFLVLVLAL